MSKNRSIPVTLLEMGCLIEELHYGPYARYWWQPSINNKNGFFPIRVGQKTKVYLKGHNFFITIVHGNKDNPSLPGYVCETSTICSLEETNPTVAISTIYQQMFNSKSTRYSGPLVIGWNDESIIEELSEIDSFSPISTSLGELKIFVSSIGSSTKKHMKNAGPGYQSSLLYRYDQKLSLFVSKIEDNACIIEIYQNFVLINTFEGASPIEVWEKTGHIQKYNGNQLFGLDDPSVQKLIQAHKIPTCVPDDWNEFSLMKPLFNYHLKKRTLANIDWHKIFLEWSQKECTIIELISELEGIYPKNYDLKKYELSSWQRMLHASGCHNITPWTQEESKVKPHVFLFCLIHNCQID